MKLNKLNVFGLGNPFRAADIAEAELQCRECNFSRHPT